MTFVPLEAIRFKEGILSNLTTEKRTLLGRIYRHPDALEPYYHNLLCSQRVKEALDILMNNHSEYRFLQSIPENVDNTSLTLQEFLNITQTTDAEKETINNNSNKQLSQLKTLAEFEEVWKLLRGQNDPADREDTLLLENTNSKDHDYNNEFLIHWQAKVPMVVFMHDSIPVEASAFPYIFYKGAEGTFGNPDSKHGQLTFADYVKFRILSLHGCLNIDP